jgi:hypothetical protein
MARRIPGTLAASLAALGLAAGAATYLAGCGPIGLGSAGELVPADSDVFGGATDAGYAQGDAGGGPVLPVVAADAAVAVEDSGGLAQSYPQSPLCGQKGFCDPDNPQTQNSAEYGFCQVQAAPPTPDAGVPGPEFDAGLDDDAGPFDDAGVPGIDAGAYRDAGVGIDSSSSTSAPSTLACRITPGDGGAPNATCSIAGNGVDGASCTTGQDCAAGFECVAEGAANGAGVCRHYCCADDCGGSATDGGVTPAPYDAGIAQAFCDIETMAAYPSNAVPVCVTRPSCTPFQPCPTAGQTCTLVDSMGTTACVTPGSQGVGQSCEEARCMESLTCWGVFPGRTCQQLCDATNPCPTGMTCQSNYSNFGSSNAGLGICLP